MDYTARDALAAGFDHAVVVVRDEVRDELLDHIAAYWPPELRVTPITQGPIAGTAQAVASTDVVVDGSFGVVNADDLYGAAAMITLAAEVLSLGPDEHVIVGYRLDQTVLTDAPSPAACASPPPTATSTSFRNRTWSGLPGAAFRASRSAPATRTRPTA